MDIFIKVIVTFFAGMGAGLGTGFAGMSAAVVTVPMLIIFLNVDPYIAVGIALASDVLASAISTVTYAKNKNIDIKRARVMMPIALLLTVAGAVVGWFVTEEVTWGKDAMTIIPVIMMIAMGIKFIVKPIMTTKESMEAVSHKRWLIGSILCGTAVGLICGFIGAGGGIMMLMLLTLVLGYELKSAVGTSVLIMTFTALVGAITHFVAYSINVEVPDGQTWLIFGLCVAFTFIWSQIAALIANKVKPITLNRTVGIILVVIGIAVTVFSFLK